MRLKGLIVIIASLVVAGFLAWFIQKNELFFVASRIATSTNPASLMAVEGAVLPKESQSIASTSMDVRQKETPASSSVSSEIVKTASVSVKKAEPDVQINEEASLKNSASIITSQAVPMTAPTTAFPFDQNWRDAIVNPFCGEAGSGSGVVIDQRGIILTNAHVALNFLFADWPKPSLFDCSIRIGSPAQTRYRAQILYIPDQFMEDVLNNLYIPDDSNFVYGRKDYALLLITKRTDPKAELPTEFAHLPLYLDPPHPKGSFFYLIGYPASFLSIETMMRNLYMVASPVYLEEVKNIGTELKAAISFRGSIAGQHGSSGGGVINNKGELSGLITFFNKGGQGADTSDNILNAITVDYISRDLKVDTGYTLREYLERTDLLKLSLEFMANKGSGYQRRFVNMWREEQDIVIPGVEY